MRHALLAVAVLTGFLLGEMAQVPLENRCGVHSAAARAGEDTNDKDADSAVVADEEAPVVRLGEIPKLRLGQHQAASPEEAIQVKQLIAGLSKLGNPDFGLSATLSGESFLPIEGMEEFQAGLITHHGLKPSPELRKLVELGPRALPFLLSALDDRTPTKLTIEHKGFFGGMWFANELWGNPVNEAENKVFSAVVRKDPFDDRQTIDSYSVKVGDVCLVAVGQIVGRGYQAVRYQPTACIVINSPTHDAELCKQVRDIWSSDDAAQKLFDSLLTDYATEGIFNGESLDGWDVGSQLQIDAAMRLLYYFPRESAPVIAERLDRLDVSATDAADDAHIDAYMKQALANGVRAENFVRAVSWCREPVIKAAVLRLLKRATDLDVVVASLPSVGRDHPELVLARVREMIEKLPETESGPFGDGYNLLVALTQYGGAQVKPTFVRYLRSGSIQRCHTMCMVLRKVNREWSVDLVGPLLTDRREIEGWEYSAIPGQDGSRLPLRVCDEAAKTISLTVPEVKFERTGTHADLDRQIEVIRQTIAHRGTQ